MSDAVKYKPKSSVTVAKGSYPVSGSGSTKANSWGGTWVLYTVIVLMTFVHFWDAGILTFRGEQPVLANYAFRETIRETRRAKTLATYARKRGPMITSTMSGFAGLSSRGVTHLEDAFGGLISGPPKLWKNGEIHVHNFKKEEVSMDIEITNFKTSAIHWNNGVNNPCADRSVYLGGQKMPSNETGETFITVAMGFLKIDCSRGDDAEQDGFLTILSSATHGGNLLGRVYSVKGVFSKSTFPVYTPELHAQDMAGTLNLSTIDVTDKSIYATSNPGAKTTLKLTEIGSLIEARGNGDPTHYHYLCLIGLAPFVIWMFFSLRLAQVEVIMNVEVDGNKNKASSNSAGSSRQSTTSTNDNDSSANSARSDDSAKAKASELRMRETRFTKFVDDRMVSCMWFSPLMHIWYIMAALVCFIYRIEDTGDVIHSFLPSFGSLRLNYVGIMIVLASQEVIWWFLSLISRIKSINSDHQRALIYAYQYNPLRFVLKVANLGTCVVLVMSTLKLFEGDADLVILCICAAGTTGIELVLILSGLSSHPFQTKVYACQIGALAEGFSITTRGMGNYLVTQDSKNLDKINQSEYTIPNLGFSGKIADGLMLGRPELMMKGVVNGKNVQIQLFELPTDSFKFSRLDNAGDGQFVLKRHWIFHGRVNMVMS